MDTASSTTATRASQTNALPDRVTAGEALHQVVRTLTEHRFLDQILDAVLAQSRAMLGASETYILLLDGDRLTLRASDGLRLATNARSELRLDEGLEGWCVQSGESVVVPDVHRDSRFVDLFDRATTVGSMIVIPLMLRKNVLGVLAATREAPGPFAEVERWWLDLFGGLTTSAIASDQGYHAQERRARQAETLLELGSLADDESDVLPRRFLETIARALNGTRAGLLLDDTGGPGAADVLREPRSERTPDAEQQSLDLTRESVLGDVYRNGSPLLVRDTVASSSLAGHALVGSARSLIAVPVVVRGVRRGVLYVTASRPSRFDSEDLAFLAMIAERVGLLIERHELHQHQREVERQQLQTEARQEFLGIVSHELKTPVAVMRAYTELLIRRAERAGRSSELDVLKRMDDQADRMLTMIDQLLDLRRLEAGLLALEESHFDLSDLARRVVRGIQLTTDKHTLRVVGERKLVVRADRRRIEEVLNNLLDNAIKYSPQGGEIVVGISRVAGSDESSDLAIVSVNDSGLGIATTDQTRVFDRFFQASRQQLHKGHAGLGLGLYVSRELIRRHGGEMWLESTEGAGSTFSFSLPIIGPSEGM